jgi:hypothetical protein
MILAVEAFSDWFAGLLRIQSTHSNPVTMIRLVL